MQILNRIKTWRGRSTTAGIKASDCSVVAGGLKANAAHFEKLLSNAGMKPSEIAALTNGHSLLAQLEAMRNELHTRGILPLASRLAAGMTTAAAADQEAPPELVQALSDFGKLVEAVKATLPARALATAAVATPAAMVPMASIEALRAEIQSLAGKLDPASIKLKMTLVKTIKQMEASTFNAGGPARMVQLKAELSTLDGRMDGLSARRKMTICSELRTLRAA